MSRYLYTLFYYLIFPLVLLRLWWRGRLAPEYRRRWLERLGIFEAPVNQGPWLWVHAVSVGETIAAVPLIKLLRQRYPQLGFVVTTMTPTGSEQVRGLFGEQVFHVYAPYDLPDCIRRFMLRIRPLGLVVMETELWPNWIQYCKSHQIPIILANGRLSERSARGYEKVKPLAGPMFASIDWVAAQNTQDAARFLRLGVTQDHLSITGSIKFDLHVDAALQEQGSLWRQAWGADRTVLVAGSTHEGEEVMLLKAFQQLRPMYPNLVLVLVPRHPERFDVVAKLIESYAISFARRSRSERFSPEVRVILGDTMGELMCFYAAADIAFVGGSLIERGGHNPLEPAALGLPVIMGPYVFNFLDICARLEAEKALLTVSEDTLLGEVQALVENKEMRQKMGGHGKAFVASNRGALEQLMAGIRQRIPELSSLKPKS